MKQDEFNKLYSDFKINVKYFTKVVVPKLRKITKVPKSGLRKSGFTH